MHRPVPGSKPHAKLRRRSNTARDAHLSGSGQTGDYRRWLDPPDKMFFELKIGKFRGAAVPPPSRTSHRIWAVELTLTKADVCGAVKVSYGKAYIRRTSR